MRRADRLFRIVEHLKTRKRVVRAQEIAERMEVSQRTIYRDIADLQMSGIPIIGEAGVGYMLDKTHILQPFIFNTEELEALILGAQMVQSWGDDKLAKASAATIDKIGSVLPKKFNEEISGAFLFSFPTKEKRQGTNLMSELRLAIRNKNKLDFFYERADGEASQRTVRPLCLAFFAPSWLLLAWCEKRQDFRNFRLDRIGDLKTSTEKFTDEKGKRLEDYIECQKTYL